MMSAPGGSSRVAAAFVVAGTSWLCACYDPLGPRTCTTEAVAGIVVDLRAAASQPLSAEDAVGRAVDGDRVEDLEPSPPDQLAGAWESPGTYVVTIEKPGFQPWTREDVRVEPGECHVRPARLEAILSPQP